MNSWKSDGVSYHHKLHGERSQCGVDDATSKLNGGHGAGETERSYGKMSWTSRSLDIAGKSKWDVHVQFGLIA